MKKYKLIIQFKYVQLLFAAAFIFSAYINSYSISNIDTSTVSLRDKISQMILVYHLPEIVEKYNVGGILLMKNMVQSDMKISKEIEDINKKLSYNLLVCIDQEGGKINRLGNLKEFKNAPSAKEMMSFTEEQILAEAKRTSLFLIQNKINVNLAPCVDPVLNSNGDSAFMWFENRSFGFTPEEIIKNAGAYINGSKENKVVTVLKHFPGYDVLTNSDLQISVSNISLEDLEISMLPFKELSNLCDAIMMNNIVYENIDSIPAVLSPEFVSMARNINKDFLIISDDLWAYSLRAFVKPGCSKKSKKFSDKKFSKIIEMAFRAGNDMLMVTYPQKVPLMIKTIEKIVLKDPLMMKSLEDSFNRILRIKKKYGIIKTSL